jgi:uncharacterized membrane protein
MKKPSFISAICLLAALLISPAVVHAQQTPPVVHAVLFYSPTCPHCHIVINETLPPLDTKYGEQLQVIGVDISQPDGGALFDAALQKFGLESGGVPFLVVGDIYLVGSLQIPQEFPRLIEAGLAQGGVDWPNIPGLSESLAQAADTTEAPVPSPALNTDPALPESIPGQTGWRARFDQDPVGNRLSVLVLIAMIASLLWAYRLFKRKQSSPKDGRSWLIPVLCVIGLGIAGYLAYVEVFEVSAVCGPVGDCTTVHQSEYSRLFGILPIGVLGLAGYIAILAAWLVVRYANKRLAKQAAAALLAMAVFGTLFSMYLTFLEPFVIGATCSWCLASAILMSVVLLASIAPVKRVLAMR